MLVASRCGGFKAPLVSLSLAGTLLVLLGFRAAGGLEADGADVGGEVLAS